MLTLSPGPPATGTHADSFSPGADALASEPSRPGLFSPVVHSSALASSLFHTHRGQGYGTCTRSRGDWTTHGVRLELSLDGWQNSLRKRSRRRGPPERPLHGPPFHTGGADFARHQDTRQTSSLICLLETHNQTCSLLSSYFFFFDELETALT